MEFTTPFLKCFGSLLFRKPAASELKKAFANLSECNSLEQLRRLFGCYIPMALLLLSSKTVSRQTPFIFPIFSLIPITLKPHAS